MKVAATFHEMSGLGLLLRSGLIDLGENPTAQDQQMEQALMAAYGVFLNGALEVVERWGLKVLNRTMAVVSGTDLLVPVEVGARRAVKSASDEGLGDAYLCGRCRVPASVDNQSREYREKEDVLGSFISDTLAIGPDLFLSGADLKIAYAAWCEYHDVPRSDVEGFRDLKESLKERYPAINTNARRRGVHGIAGLGRKCTDEDSPLDAI